jgi:hypothetical protein
VKVIVIILFIRKRRRISNPKVLNQHHGKYCAEIHQVNQLRHHAVDFGGLEIAIVCPFGLDFSRRTIGKQG